MNEQQHFKIFHDMQPGEHLCWLYRDTPSHQRLWTEFIFQGLERHQKVMIIYHALTPEEIRQRLAGQRVNTAQAIATGQLLLAPYHDIYLHNDEFQPEDILNALRQACEQALAEGYSALRVTGEMSWLPNTPGNRERLLAYENHVNHLLQDYPIVALCKYQRDMFDPDFLLNIFRSHPLLLVDDEIHPNPYYIPPNWQEQAGPDTSALDFWIDTIATKNRIEQKTLEREKKFRMLYEDAPLAYQSLDIKGHILDVNPAWCKLLGYSHAEALGTWFGDYLIPEQQELFRRRFEQFKARGNVQDVEFEMVRKDGTHLVISATGQIGYNDQGDFHQTHCILTDITHKKIAEEENQRVNAALKQRLVALSQPLTQLEKIQFEDLFDLEDIQAIQDAFSNATGVASIITRTDGHPITRPSNFCHLCINIIRETPKGLANCMESDRVIGSPRSDGPTIRPCLSGGLFDAGASIMVGDHHIANWLIGQVVDTDANLEQMMDYAKEIGADADSYRAALQQVKKMPAAQFANVSQALYLISAQLSQLAVQNIQQARVISEREQAQSRLARVNRLYAVVSRISQVAVKVRSARELYESACQILIQEGQFKLAWVGLLSEARQVIEPFVWAGEEQGYLNSYAVPVDASSENQGPVNSAFREKRLACYNHIESDPRVIYWRERALQRGFQSIASFPLLVSEQVIGTMTVYASEPDFFDDREASLLQEISDTLSFALESIEKEKRRRRAEIALLESEEKYRRLFTSGNDAVLVYPLLDGNHPGNFTEVNPVACERLGYTEAELLNLSVKDIARSVDQVEMQEIYQTMIKQKGELFQARHFTKDGREIPVEVNARTFEHQGRRFVQSIARDITERKQAEQQIQKQIQRLFALRTIDSAINRKDPLPAIMEIILAEVMEQLRVSAAAILLYEPEGHLLRFAYGKGFQTRVIEQISIPLQHKEQQEPQASTISADDLPCLEPACRQDIFTAEGFVSYYPMPVMANESVLGILEIYHHEAMEAEVEWVDYLATLAGQAAIAIEDCRLLNNLVKSNQELTQAYDEIIAGWSRALDLRDRETKGHSQRVTEMTLQLAQAMGIAEAELVHLRRGALLHDIGKVGVPDRILLKPELLTTEELQVMRRHPQYAVDLLAPIAFLRPALAIPYCHHEKWDGTGYPRGLKGEEIPLSARIFAVIDVWDALLSDRPYRRGWPVEEVLDYIEAQSGKHFDPQVVTAFLTYVQHDPKLLDTSPF